MVRIIGIGDAKMDKNITDMIAYPGGQAMNIAVNAKLQGAQAGFIGCIGDDVLGQHLAKTLDELGVDRSRSHIVHADNAATKYQVIDGGLGRNQSPADFPTADGHSFYAAVLWAF